MELGAKEYIDKWLCTSFLSDGNLSCCGLNVASEDDTNDRAWKNTDLIDTFPRDTVDHGFAVDRTSSCLADKGHTSEAEDRCEAEKLESISQTLPSHARTNKSNKLPELTLFNILVMSSTGDSSDALLKMNSSMESLSRQEIHGANEEGRFDQETNITTDLSVLRAKDSEETHLLFSEQQESTEGDGTSSIISAGGRYTSLYEITNGMDHETQVGNFEFGVLGKTRSNFYNDGTDDVDQNFHKSLGKRNLFPSKNSKIIHNDSSGQDSFTEDSPSPTSSVSPPFHEIEQESINAYENIFVDEKVKSSPVSVIQSVKFCDTPKDFSPVSVIQTIAFKPDKDMMGERGRFFGSSEHITEVFSENNGFELVHKETFSLRDKDASTAPTVNRNALK